MPDTISLPHDYLGELKAFAALHARASGLSRTAMDYALADISSDTPGELDSWAAVWSRLGKQAEAEGKPSSALQLFNMARFPYPADEIRTQAEADCLRAFGAYRARGGNAIERMAVTDGTPTSYLYATGLDRNLPLLVVSGGIVSIKEQWWTLLEAGSRLGFAVALYEMPGVGENANPYAARPTGFVSTVLDRLAGRADVSQASVMALSFSCHLVLLDALADRRIAAIATVGAPVHHFFTDLPVRADLPLVTRATLAHLLDCPPEKVAEAMKGWELTADHLRSLECRVSYVASRRDEVVPNSDLYFLRDNVRHFESLLVDDVHAAPSHPRLVRLFMVAALLQARSVARPAASARARASTAKAALAVLAWQAGGRAA